MSHNEISSFGKHELIPMDEILEYLWDQHNLYRSKRKFQMDIILPVVSLKTFINCFHLKIK